jgi:hypothetical protein
MDRGVPGDPTSVAVLRGSKAAKGVAIGEAYTSQHYIAVYGSVCFVAT